MMTPMRITALLLAIGCIALGAAALNLTQQNRELRERQAAVAVEPPPIHSRPPGMEERGGLRRALEAEQLANQELRVELARLKGEPVPVMTNVAAASPEMEGGRYGRGGDQPGGWMDRLRQEDPERYKQIMADREQRRKDAEDWYNTTLGQLQARVESPVSPEDGALAKEIAAALWKMNDLRQQMQAARDLPDDERQTAMTQLIAELRATNHQLDELRQKDRNLQLQNLATQLGLKGDNVQALVDGVPQIYKNTQYAPNRASGFGGGATFQVGRQSPAP